MAVLLNESDRRRVCSNPCAHAFYREIRTLVLACGEGGVLPCQNIREPYNVPRLVGGGSAEQRVTLYIGHADGCDALRHLARYDASVLLLSYWGTSEHRIINHPDDPTGQRRMHSAHYTLTDTMRCAIASMLGKQWCPVCERYMPTRVLDTVVAGHPYPKELCRECAHEHARRHSTLPDRPR